MAEDYRNAIIAMLGVLSEDDLDLIRAIMVKMVGTVNNG